LGTHSWPCHIRRGQPGSSVQQNRNDSRGAAGAADHRHPHPVPPAPSVQVPGQTPQAVRCVPHRVHRHFRNYYKLAPLHVHGLAGEFKIKIWLLKSEYFKQYKTKQANIQIYLLI